MILVDKNSWKDKAILLRGWGRSSSRFSESEDIKKRFNIKLDNIPYDTKFLFEAIGYNFLPSEIGAAFGNEQIKKLPKFRKTREKNFAELLTFFKKYEKLFILPSQNEQVRTQWLAFPLTIRKNAPFARKEIVTFLETNNVQTRPIFTGNIMKQPAFKNIVHKSLHKDYSATNEIMERGFLIGCHHGLEKQHLKRLKELFTKFLQKYV